MAVVVPVGARECFRPFMMLALAVLRLKIAESE